MHSHRPMHLSSFARLLGHVPVEGEDDESKEEPVPHAGAHVCARAEVPQHAVLCTRAHGSVGPARPCTGCRAFWEANKRLTHVRLLSFCSMQYFVRVQWAG